MRVGEVVRLKKQNYVVVNKEGALEKLPEVNFICRFYFEIMQGLGIHKSIAKVRQIFNKNKKRS